MSCRRGAEGQFEDADFADTPDDLRAKYFSPTAPFTAIPAVRSIVRFGATRHVIWTSALLGNHDPIVCRNVLIYFDRDSRKNAYSRCSIRLSRQAAFSSSVKWKR